MKRGFLNTSRSKRAIEEVYAPQPPPGPSSSSLPSRRDGDAKVAAIPDAMDCGVDSVKDTYALQVPTRVASGF